ncbi:polysaccharide deacetylase family protein [Bianquea renquensis]|uniref:NodB homology domain-containing protein n=1 Tax=Bianquea renquensis TaxID=2763661 RepID=A0A926DU13_9FIRM|nr:polysaccharide deacetylase family protein [Bianquea renquensis]MBC8543359.1 hypothetical protein [Bianquea renquensis]
MAKRGKAARPLVVLLVIELLILAGGGILYGYLKISNTSLSELFNSRTAGDVISAFTEKALTAEQTGLNKEEGKLNRKGEKYRKPLYQEMKRIMDMYCNEELSYDQLVRCMRSYQLFAEASGQAGKYLSYANSIQAGREAYREGVAYAAKEDYTGALECFKRVDSEDPIYSEKAEQEKEKMIQKLIEIAPEKVNEYLCQYKIEEARAFVGELFAASPDDPALNGLDQTINEYEAFQTELVEYTGPVEHVFTHCLIAFPELCYSSPSMTKSLDTDCVTPHEFALILENLYEKGYILIDINLLLDESGEGDRVAKLMLPKGKKPLVLSVDDVVYDARKMHTGMVDKLVVDDRGRVLSYTKTAAGDEIYSYENEVFPIVDSFVREHPDFSFQGARGTLCLTGFQGIFGYRTQTGAPEGTDREAEKEGALQVVAALKEEGWNFASHGYGHYHMDQIEYSKVEYDTASWQAEVASLVGPTKVMVWPYGGHVRSGKIHELLYDTGFRIFCGVGAKPYLAREPDGLGIFQDRKALDGYSLRNRREMYLYLFDTEEVWDPLRPKDVSW